MKWDKRLKAAEILKSMIRVTEDRVKGAHDAQMVILDGLAYIVYEANDVRPGENGDWPYVYCAMSVVDAENMQVLRVQEIARPEQTFANQQLKAGACFVPRVLIKDEHTLRVYFVSMQPGVRQAETWYVDYDTVSGQFADCIYPVMLESCLGLHPMTPYHFHAQAAAQGFAKPACDSGMYLFDVDKRIDGKRYVGLNNFLGKQNALGVWNDTLDTVRVLGNINEPQSEALSECAVNRMPDGSWLAILRNDAHDCNSMFSTSQDGVSWSEAVHWPLVQNGSNSKPLLDCFEGVYFLGWQEKPYRTRFNIALSRDGKNWVHALAFDDADFSLQYPSLALRRGTVYLCGTHGSVGEDGDQRDSIWFAPLMTVNEAQELCE